MLFSRCKSNIQVPLLRMLCRFSYYLTNVRLSNNQLTGRIPQEVAVLPFLESMHLSNNTFSCMGTASVNSTGPDACSNAEQVLPCFLRLTEYTVPRSDASNMECPDVIRKPRSNIIADCAESGAVGLVSTVLHMTMSSVCS